MEKDACTLAVVRLTRTTKGQNALVSFFPRRILSAERKRQNLVVEQNSVHFGPLMIRSSGKSKTGSTPEEDEAKVASARLVPDRAGRGRLPRGGGGAPRTCINLDGPRVWEEDARPRLRPRNRAPPPGVHLGD
jgi:hypothetical protein